LLLIIIFIHYQNNYMSELVQVERFTWTRLAAFNSLTKVTFYCPFCSAEHSLKGLDQPAFFKDFERPFIETCNVCGKVFYYQWRMDGTFDVFIPKEPEEGPDQPTAQLEENPILRTHVGLTPGDIAMQELAEELSQEEDDDREMNSEERRMESAEYQEEERELRNMRPYQETDLTPFGSAGIEESRNLIKAIEPILRRYGMLVVYWDLEDVVAASLALGERLEVEEPRFILEGLRGILTSQLGHSYIKTAVRTYLNIKREKEEAEHEANDEPGTQATEGEQSGQSTS
jgi:hypothetical protein